MQSATVNGYQKNGIAADGVGSKVTVTGSTVDGGGQTSTIARNGIEIVRGATGTVNKTTISNDEYTGTSGSAAASGVLVYGGCGDPLATNVTASGNTVTDNDTGVALDNFTADCSTSATTVPDNIVKNNTISKDDGETNQSPFTDWQNTAYTGYQVGIGDSDDGDHIRQTGGDTQQVSITNWELNGKYFFAG